MLGDTPELREFLRMIYPNFKINFVAKASGQRVVYFGLFIDRNEVEPEGCDLWGEVVLKISEASSKSTISYIQKEIEVLNTLNSKSFPKLYFDEVITIDPISEEPINPVRMISIEEKIESKLLSEIMHEYQAESKVIDFLIKIIVALRCLWEYPQKLVHRDLKPDNILIKDDGSIVIIDLGILRQQGVPGNTQSFLSFGPCTPCYASPEQATNDKRNITFKTDFFSIGIICYEMLSTKNPFICEGEENYIEDILNRVCNFEPPKLIDMNVSNDLSKIISKMMSKDPYKRFRTVDLLLSELLEAKKCH